MSPATIAAVPGVELVVPVVSSTAFMADGSGELLTVQGMDIANQKAIAVYELRDEERGLDDPKLFLSDAIVIPRAFADRRGLKLGDAITIDTPRGQQRVTVRGTLDPHGLARIYGGNLLLMDLGNAQDMFGRPGFVNRVDVVVDRDGDVQRVARRHCGRAAARAARRAAEPAQGRPADGHVLLPGSALGLGLARSGRVVPDRVQQLGDACSKVVRGSWVCCGPSAYARASCGRSC